MENQAYSNSETIVNVKQPQPGGAPSMILQLPPGTTVLNLEALTKVSFYYIRKTGTTTREACDASGTKLFSQKETASGLQICLSLIDNTGYEFVTAELGMNKFRILSHGAMLGSIDMNSKYGKTMIGNSSMGLGTIKLQPEEGDGSYPWCLIYCRSCWASSLNKFVIFHNDQPIGEIKRNKGDGKVSVSFPEVLDNRIKSVIVVGAFALYNMYWRPALCCGCCC